MKKLKKSLAILGFLAFGLAVGYFGGKFIAESDQTIGLLDLSIKDTGWPKVLLIGTFILMSISVIAIHELGHLIAGLVQGFQFQLYVVGLLGIKRTEQGTIRPYLNTSLGMAGGLAATIPTKIEPDSINKFARVILAGPLTSILSIPILLLIAYITPPPWPFLFTFMALMSFMIFLATTLPSKSGIFYTDRKRYQRLKSNGIEREIEMAVLQANTLKITGQSMNDMDIVALEKIKLDESPMMQYFGLLYEYEYHIKGDQSKLANIKEQLETVSEELPKSTVKLFSTELDKLDKLLVESDDRISTIKEV